MRFFFYGTLMDRDVLACVLGRPVPEAHCEPAVLPGYRRARVRRRHFPMLVPSSTATVDGYIVSRLDVHAALRLAWHEHVGYDIVRARPVLSYGQPIPAWIFLSRRGVMEPAQAWSLDAWQRTHKRQALTRLQRVLRTGRPMANDMATARLVWSQRREL